MASFKFTSTLLHHLGAGLYRNMETSIAEAISNSWDANARNVYINYDDDKQTMTICDDGVGMNCADFEDKFLLIGHKRRASESVEGNKRYPIGRKGIGKLALLSVSEILTVYSKKQGSEKFSGGIIDNKKIDEKIKNDNDREHSYELGEIVQKEAKNVFNTLLKNKSSGTILIFKKINAGYRSPELLKSKLAVAFDTSLLQDGDKFNLYVNGDPVKHDYLDKIISDTQYIWSYEKASLKNFNFAMNNIKVEEIKQHSFDFQGKTCNIKGFIASVKSPAKRNVIVNDNKSVMKVGVYTNNRLRVLDVLGKIPRNRIAESYLWGRIHADFFDNNPDKNAPDNFTSSREDITNSPLYEEFLKCVKINLSQIIAEWGKRRVLEGEKKNQNLDGKYKFDLSDKGKTFRKGLRTVLQKKIDDPKRREDEVIEYYMKSIDDYMGKDQTKSIFLSYKSSNSYPRNKKRDYKSEKVAENIKKLFIACGVDEEYIFFEHEDHKQTSIPADENVQDSIRAKITGKAWERANKLVSLPDVNHELMFITIASSYYYNNWYTAIEFGAAWGSVLKRKNIKHVVVGNGVPIAPANPSGNKYAVFDECELTKKITIQSRSVHVIKHWVEEALKLTKASSEVEVEVDIDQKIEKYFHIIKHTKR